MWLWLVRSGIDQLPSRSPSKRTTSVPTMYALISCYIIIYYSGSIYYYFIYYSLLRLFVADWFVFQMPSVKVEQDENPNFRMRPQLTEITYQFLQQYWPLRFDSAAILAGIREKIRPHETEVARHRLHPHQYLIIVFFF